MLRRGASPLDIQKLLGHADLKNLSQYLAVSIAEMRQCHRRSRLGA
jgi:site-specific recombinase XerD